MFFHNEVQDLVWCFLGRRQLVINRSLLQVKEDGEPIDDTSRERKNKFLKKDYWLKEAIISQGKFFFTKIFSIACIYNFHSLS